VNRSSWTIAADCHICGDRMTAERPAVFQRRERSGGRWIPVLAEWRPAPGLLAHPACFVGKRGRLAIYLALARDLGSRASPLFRALGNGP
jgi:hypothetical protein